ncbi:RNase A-like domain-containing protein [Candidatus Amarobacter glycogenicus]|uniref:RNase A-like domain-containing protein n=1 Tax=Candidatus Amarobacter glycogenicus TaxID=3140699 RepID=UPI003135C109|nr:hypothetical protein [Dehalococcoidia bacterium]
MRESGLRGNHQSHVPPPFLGPPCGRCRPARGRTDPAAVRRRRGRLPARCARFGADACRDCRELRSSGAFAHRWRRYGHGPLRRDAADPHCAATTAQSRDLSIDEARGGHTLARHVGKSDAELLARLKAEPDISAASTYTDRATAERVVAQVITKKRAEIEKWEARDGSRTNLALRLALGVVIGRSIEQGETRAVEVRDAVVVLRWTGTGWYVLTSYPEDR